MNAPRPAAAAPAAAPRWSVIIPYFNEADFIATPLASAMAQAGTTLRLILVDNRSSDNTTQRAAQILSARPDLEVVYLSEDKPGQNYALARGFAYVLEHPTQHTAFWDADTHYPSHYLAEAERLLSRPGVVVAQGIDVYGAPGSIKGRRRRSRMVATQWLLSRQGHTGSYGQCFQTEALARAKGPLSPDWPFVLYDHELMQRIYKQGKGAGSMALWCQPSPRRSANAHVRWTLGERILYHATPFALKDWFFYNFLANRFARRKMMQENLRQRDW